MPTTWTVTRNGERVASISRRPVGFAETDTEAIAEALEEYLSDDGVKLIHFDGRVLVEQGLPDGLGGAIRHLGKLARNLGKRFDVGPI